MLADISKTFGYDFDQTTLSELCALGTSAVGFDGFIELGAVGFDGFIESALKNLPGLDYDNIQTVKDVLSHLTTTLDHTAGILPYKEQLVEMLTDVSNSPIVSGLPILNCITAISTTLSTGFLAVAYIETMKTYKKEGRAWKTSRSASSEGSSYSTTKICWRLNASFMSTASPNRPCRACVSPGWYPRRASPLRRPTAIWSRTGWRRLQWRNCSATGSATAPWTG